MLYSLYIHVMTLNNSDMDKLKQLLKEITSERKWYAIYPEEHQQTRLRVTALRILQGKCSIEATQRFFGEFGREVKVNISA